MIIILPVFNSWGGFHLHSNMHSLTPPHIQGKRVSLGHSVAESYSAVCILWDPGRKINHNHMFWRWDFCFLLRVRVLSSYSCSMSWVDFHWEVWGIPARLFPILSENQPLFSQWFSLCSYRGLLPGYFAFNVWKKQQLWTFIKSNLWNIKVTFYRL